MGKGINDVVQSIADLRETDRFQEQLQAVRKA